VTPAARSDARAVGDRGRSAVHRAQDEELAAGVLDDELPDNELPDDELAAGELEDESDEELLDEDEPDDEEPDEDAAGVAEDFESRESVR
jgi:hypothetical protein